MTKLEHAPTTNSRRGLLMGLAAAAVVPAPGFATTLAPASGNDPIYALIEAYDRVANQECALYRECDNLEQALPEEQQTWSIHFAGDGRWPPEGCADAPEWIKAQLAIGEVSDRQSDLMLALLTTAPTTIEGVAALLERLGAATFPEEQDVDGAEPLLANMCEWYDKRVAEAAAAFHTMLAAALRKIAERATGA